MPIAGVSRQNRVTVNGLCPAGSTQRWIGSRVAMASSSQMGDTQLLPEPAEIIAFHRVGGIVRL